MQKITITNFNKYRDLILKVEQELEREILFEEFAVEAGFYSEKERIFAKELFYFIKDDIEIPSENPEKYELILKRGLGNNEIRKRRIKKGLKQADIAIKMNCSSILVSHWECCRTYPSEDQQNKLAKILDCKKEFLFPKWLKFVAEELKERKTEQIIEIGKLSLNSPDLLMLESEDSNIISEKKISDKLKAEEVLKTAKRVCTPRELKVIELRFGLNGHNQMTIEEIGMEFGVSRSRIDQILQKALEKIRCEIEY